MKKNYMTPELELREFKAFESIAGPTIPAPPGGISGSIGGELGIDITEAITSYNVESVNSYNLAPATPPPTPAA